MVALDALMLAAHANAYLAGNRFGLADNYWYPTVATLQARLGLSIVANEPIVWFQNLGERGYLRAGIFVSDGIRARDIRLVGIAGFQYWGIETASSESSTLWFHSSIGSRRDEANPPKVYLAGYPRPPDWPGLGENAEDAERDLRAILLRMSDFDRNKGRGWFHPLAEHALRELDGHRPFDPVIEGLFPDGVYPESSYRLATAVWHVFTGEGFGSWWDQGYKDPETNREFREMSGSYNLAMHAAICAACNVDLLCKGP